MDTPESSPPVASSALLGLVVTAYALPWSRFENAYPRMAAQIIATRFDQSKPTKWAIREGGCVLAKHGEWEYEPNPSSRNEEFLERTRWDSAEEAAAFAALHRPNVPDQATASTRP